MNTHKFNLVSGVPAEVTFFTGEHQRILTQRLKGQTHIDRLNLLLTRTLLKVGSYDITKMTEDEAMDFVQKMLRQDRRKALCEARQFSMGFEKAFNFEWEYEKESGGKATYKLEVKFEDEKSFPTTPMEVQFDDYDELMRNLTREIVLPISGEKIKYNLLDGKGERYMSSLKKEEMSSHTPIYARRPVKIVEGEEVKIDLDKMHFLDVDALRSAMLKGEGKVDTEIKFAHPEAEHKQEGEKMVIVDVLDSVPFFFPSGTIL